MRSRRFTLLAAPGVLLGIVGATHPRGLNPDTAQHYVTDQLGDDAVPRPPAISLAFRIGPRLGDVGAWALLLAAALLAVDVIRRHGVGTGWLGLLREPAPERGTGATVKPTGQG